MKITKKQLKESIRAQVKEALDSYLNEDFSRTDFKRYYLDKVEAIDKAINEEWPEVTVNIKVDRFHLNQKQAIRMVNALVKYAKGSMDPVVVKQMSFDAEKHPTEGGVDILLTIGMPFNDIESSDEDEFGLFS